ncbi:MAG: 2-oxoacid:acceptor oxidoreductase family protein [Spirochaeta sp.]|jgi:2-oxoglutarate ferredoxin oxidoreductase subunit gamma|nr:2-oxoacid:acceptor oxidoreductase family protein [Spirochaeta sp.]
MIWKLIFSGVGGQGVISAGILLSEAAVIHENRFAVQSQSYGAEMRGGLSRADVTISDDPVIYPKVDQAHVLLCLHRKGLGAHLAALRPGGILITDRDEAPVTARVDCRQYEVPIITTCREELGSPRSANICLLGVLSAVTGVVAADSLGLAIDVRFGAKSAAARDTNRRALALGLDMGAGIRSEASAAGESDRRGRHATSARM